jgi:hypothetical protein
LFTNVTETHVLLPATRATTATDGAASKLRQCKQPMWYRLTVLLQELDDVAGNVSASILWIESGRVKRGGDASVTCSASATNAMNI